MHKPIKTVLYYQTPELPSYFEHTLMTDQFDGNTGNFRIASVV
jgi:hypothetical protein